MEMISSLDNNQVKYWNSLNQKKIRDEEGLFLVEGDHLVLEADKCGLIQELIVNVDISVDYKAPINLVSKAILDKISSMPSSPDVIAVCRKIEESAYGDKLVLIDALQDPGNLGTIIRSAVAFNIDTIVLGNNTVDIYNEKTIRASEGMLFHINIIKRDLNTFIDELHTNKYMVYGTDVNDGILLSDIKSTNKYAFIVGNEGAGVNPELLNKCDSNIYIPMNELAESLNVGVATGIILYALGEVHE